MYCTYVHARNGVIGRGEPFTTRETGVASEASVADLGHSCDQIMRKDNGSTDSLFRNHPGNARKAVDALAVEMAEARNMLAQSLLRDKTGQVDGAVPEPGAVGIP